MTRTNRRTKRTGTFVGVVLACGLAASACGGGKSTASVEVQDKVVTTLPSGQQIVVAASRSTVAVDSGKLSVTMKVDGDVEGTPIHTSVFGQGRFAAKGRQSETTIDMSTYVRQIADAGGVPPQGMPSTWQMGVIVDGSMAYLKVHTDPPARDDGVWYSIDLTNEAAQLGLSSENLLIPGGLGSGSLGFVDALSGSGPATTRGSERIDGASVTHYEGTLDPAVALQTVAADRHDQLQQSLTMAGITQPTTYGVWVDSAGVVRRLRLDLTADLGAAGKLTIGYTLGLSDLGTGGAITPPSEKVVPVQPGGSIGGSAVANA